MGRGCGLIYLCLNRIFQCVSLVRTKGFGFDELDYLMRNKFLDLFHGCQNLAKKYPRDRGQETAMSQEGPA